MSSLTKRVSKRLTRERNMNRWVGGHTLGGSVIMAVGKAKGMSEDEILDRWEPLVRSVKGNNVTELIRSCMRSVGLERLPEGLDAFVLISDPDGKLTPIVTLMTRTEGGDFYYPPCSDGIYPRVMCIDNYEVEEVEI